MNCPRNGCNCEFETLHDLGAHLNYGRCGRIATAIPFTRPARTAPDPRRSRSLEEWGR